MNADRMEREVRITSVTATQPTSAGSPNDWRTSMGQIAVSVETEDGLTGYGVGGGGAAGIHVIQTELRRLLLGSDATRVEDLWDDMYRATRPYGRKGIAVMAVSGVDLALWDLRGKRERKPITGVLAGDIVSPTDAVPCYMTGFSAEEVIRSGAKGFRALKFHVGLKPNRNIADVVVPIRRAREVLGPDVRLMADAAMNLDVEAALRLIDALQGCNLDWLEEPLPPEDLEGYGKLRDRSPIPIAGGEHEYTADAFEVLMRDRLHAIVQPDVTWCGGLTELLKIYKMGERHGIRVCPHRGSEIWALHAIASIDPNPLAESGRPWIDWVNGQPEIADGSVAPGSEPGFGVRLPIRFRNQPGRGGQKG